jgi:radical SAM superfamily enzyme YgiQ (UPF0313 family)
MEVVLISTYELGHQPFGLASPAAWLADAGFQVTCFDLSRQEIREDAIREADFIGLYLPMHTATRLAIALVPRIRELNSRAHLCFFGLYAPVNEAHLREIGAQSILGGEFEEALLRLVESLSSQRTVALTNGGNSAGRVTRRVEPVISLARQKFRVPRREGLPALHQYGHVILADGSTRISGYTEASRGCKHLCRHCPVVPVYNGVFRIVDRDVVLADVRQQVEAGAEHISFGDPDFLNGPSHAMSIVEEFHRQFPGLSYDATIKIEHLLRHSSLLPRLRDTGCLFITSAVESVDDSVLQRLDKGHTRADFVRVTELFLNAGMTLLPTFVPFTPWTTLEGYCDLLKVVAEQGLIENVAPIQLAIRLLIPAGSRLLELSELRGAIDAFDSAALIYPWRHADARVDAVAGEVRKIVERGEKFGRSRGQIFERITAAAWSAAGIPGNPFSAGVNRPVPHSSEAWYCCAEPTDEQFTCIKPSSPAVVAESCF